MGSVPGIKSMVDSTSLSGGNPAISFGNCTDECLKHSSYTRVSSSFSHLFYNNFIVFVARSLILCLVWLQVHWSVKSSFWKQFWNNEEQARK